VLLLIAVSYVVWMYAYPMAYSKPDQVLPYRILASSKNFNELTSVLGSLRERGPPLDLGGKGSNAKPLWVLARIPADTVERTRVLHIANRSVQKGDAVILDEFGQALLYAHFNNEQEPVNAARALPGYAITLPERVDNSNVQAVLKSLEAECKARRLTKESRVLVDLVRLKEFDSTVLSALLEMGRYAGKPLAVHNPPRKLVSLAELYGVADFLLDDHPELRRMRQEREEKGQ